MTALTMGIHHVGLTVSRLEESAAFFVGVLGWQEVRRNEAYPAIYVSDGQTLVTLWKARVEPVAAFDRNSQVGLHHVAFTVPTEDALEKMYERLLAHDVEIEFSPEMLRQGPARHMMCIEPSGIRVEFIWPAS